MFKELKAQGELLATWVQEITTINANPYTKGLDIDRMLKDLQGFANTLQIEIAKAEESVSNQVGEEVEPQAPEKAE